MRTLVALLALLTAAAVAASPAQAGKCTGSIFNPLTDIAWEATMPIKIGSISILAGSGKETSDISGSASPICTCTPAGGLPWAGLSIALSDIDNLVEVVREPGCSPFIGKSLWMNDRGFFGGSLNQKTSNPAIFKQVHWLKFPAFYLLNLLTDVQCVAKGAIAFLDPTEVMPDHQAGNDFIATLARPDGVLFANPAFDLLMPASVAIAHAPEGILPTAYDSMFWLWWDNIYPLNGVSLTKSDLRGSVQVTAKQLYKLQGIGLHTDNVTNQCQATVKFLPKKSHWRFQLAKPVKTARHFVASESEFSWGLGGKNPPFKEGNFLHVLFQRKRCCEKVVEKAISAAK